MTTIRLGKQVISNWVRATIGGVSQTVKSGEIEAELELIIDPAKIPSHKIHKAMTARSQKTVTNGGLVVIRVVPGTKRQTNIVAAD